MAGVGRMEPDTRRTLWWGTAEPSPPIKPFGGDIRADVAIVGAGFTGLTAALHLVERGAKVVVLEAREIGAGASGVNAGFVVPNFSLADPQAVLGRLGEERGRVLLALVARGGERVFGTAEKYGIACDAAQTGWLQPAHSAAADETVKARVAFWRALGRPVEHLSGAKVEELTGMAIYRGALLDRSGGTIQPLSYLRGLARSAIAAGASIFQHATVRAARRQGEHWRLDCEGGTVEAKTVLLCTNAAGDGLARRMAQTIVPLAVYQIATEPLPEDIVRRIAPQRQPLSDMRANLFTYRLDRDDRLISGGMALVPLDARRRMAAAIASRLKRELTLPFVPKVDFAWQGTAAVTPDFLPRLYEFGPGFFGGIGCNGRGIAMTAMLGEVLADAACGAALDTLPVPVAAPKALPFHRLAGIAASIGLARARLQDWRAGVS